jgi:peptidoglycan/LPS O-acetylase OafA/YrhL
MHCFGFSGGVDVFFVISGCPICSIILRELANGSFSIAKFYECRCKSILPALMVVLLFCMVVGACLLSPVEEKHLGKGVMATILSVFRLLAPGSIANRLLGLRPFRAIGQISYSMYLWHWPLLSFAAIVSPGELSPAVRAILMFLAAAAATLS